MRQAIPSRICSSCGKDDVVHIVEGQYDAAQNPKVEHFVTIELRYLKKPSDFTPRLKHRGWRFRIHQGRDAMERFICRPCMTEHAIMDREMGRKKSEELKSSMHHDSYYAALCGD